jgi:hypothetical protein
MVLPVKHSAVPFDWDHGGRIVPVGLTLQLLSVAGVGQGCPRTIVYSIAGDHSEGKFSEKREVLPLDCEHNGGVCNRFLSPASGSALGPTGLNLGT